MNISKLQKTALLPRLLSSVKNIVKKLRLPERSFYVGYFLIIISSMYDNITEIQKLLFLADILAIGLFILSISCSLLVSRNLSKKSILINLTLFTIVIFISSFFSGSRALIKLPFAITAFIGINMNFPKLARYDLIVRSSLLLILTLLTVSGINHNTVLDYRSGTMRNSFGTTHPNAFGFELAIICADIFYLTSIHKSSKHILREITSFIFAITAIFFNLHFVDSRTSVLLIVLFGITYIAHKKIQIINNFVAFCIKNIFAILIIVTFASVVFFQNGNPFAQKVDSILSYRLHLNSAFLETYNILPFGQPIADIKLFATEFPYPLDNSYLNLLLQFGALITIYLTILYYKSISKLLIDQQTMLVFIMVILAFYGFSETSFFIISKNPFLLLLAYGITISPKPKDNYCRKILDFNKPAK